MQHTTAIEIQIHADMRPVATSQQHTASVHWLVDNSPCAGFHLRVVQITPLVRNIGQVRQHDAKMMPLHPRQQSPAVE
ncbi:hypothetical protein AN416_07170 [Paraburkholderia caribensis]|nr:hypothetical protein AN416_07170 [Paraburkholderia caribensis]